MKLQILVIILSLLWAGMTLGISFLESWAKFRAQSLSRAVGLDVGRTVFAIFHKVQLFFLVALIGLIIAMPKILVIQVMMALIVLIFLTQTFILLPRLNQRVALILKGVELQKSVIHSIYGLLELFKLCLLLGLAIYLLSEPSLWIRDLF